MSPGTWAVPLEECAEWSGQTVTQTLHPSSLRPHSLVSLQWVLGHQKPVTRTVGTSVLSLGGHNFQCLETDGWAKGLVQSRILSHLRSSMNSDVKDSFPVSLVSVLTPVGTWQDDTMLTFFVIIIF